MHKADGSGAATSVGEVTVRSTYLARFDPEEALVVILAANAPVTVVALDRDNSVLGIREMLPQVRDGVRRSINRQTVYASFFGAAHHTRVHLDVAQFEWRGCRESC